MSITINGDGIISGVSTFSNNTATFSGNVGVAGTLTYEDVTNIDSVGLITARSGVVLTGGDVTLGTGVTISGQTSDTFTILTGGSERVRVSAGGSLSIGTSSPVALAHLANTSSTGGYNFLQITAGGESQVHTIKSTIATGRDLEINTARTLKITTGSNTGTFPSEGHIQFSHGTNGELARIDNSGRLLLGTSTEISSGSLGLHVKNTNIGSTALQSWNTTASGTIFHITFRDGASGLARGNITTDGSTTTYGTTSDYRLKENVAPLTGATEKVKELKPSTFNFISSYKTVSGFIAHEAQAVVPECVTGTKDEVDSEGNPIYQNIDQSKLVPLLTAALQEAITRIESLEAEVAALKAS